MPRMSWTDSASTVGGRATGAGSWEGAVSACSARAAGTVPVVAAVGAAGVPSGAAGTVDGAGAAAGGAAGVPDAGRGAARSDRAAARRCVPGSLALQRVKITEGYLLLRVVARDRAVGMAGPPGRGPGKGRLGTLSASICGMQQTSRILVIVTLCRYEPTHGHTSSVADRTDIRQTPGCPRGVPHSGTSGVPGLTARQLLWGTARQLASLCRPVPAASSNSARGFSSEPSETISRLNRPASVHSASTRALRLKVGTRLRW